MHIYLSNGNKCDDNAALKSIKNQASNGCCCRFMCFLLLPYCVMLKVVLTTLTCTVCVVVIPADDKKSE